jgi:hypothetical protein
MTPRHTRRHHTTPNVHVIPTADRNVIQVKVLRSHHADPVRPLCVTVG